MNDNLGSPAAADTTLGVERLQPLFHLFNGDLCYANLATDRVRTWWDFWENNSRSARNRPWMPSAGNHENELGNGPIGYRAYQTYFSVPEAAGQTDVTRGLWYAFTAGSVRVISIANDDIVYQDGGNSYVRGYSSGAQKAWLEKELAAARREHRHRLDRGVHAPGRHLDGRQFNGADLGIREEWVPLFDKYGVDLVVCGHEHHYERSHPIRGREVERHPDADPGCDRDRCDRYDQGNGAHGDRRRRHVRPVEPAVLQPAGMPRDHRASAHPIRRPASVRRSMCKEHAPWSAVRNAAHAYGFAAFTVDPGSQRGGFTTIKVTYYDVVGTGRSVGAVRNLHAAPSSPRLNPSQQGSSKSDLASQTAITQGLGVVASGMRINRILECASGRRRGKDTRTMAAIARSSFMVGNFAVGYARSPISSCDIVTR